MDMDPHKGLDAEHQYWIDLLNAIEDAETLPLDEQFNEAVRENAVAVTSNFYWETGDAPLSFVNNELFNESLFTAHIESPVIDVRYIQLNFLERGGFYDIRGAIHINDIEYLISSDVRLGKWYALQTDTGVPTAPLVIAPKDINSLLTSIVGSFLDEHPSKVESIVDLHMRHKDKSDASGLGATISAMGNLLGSSSRTTLAYFDTSESDGMFVELTDAESPTESGAQNSAHVFSNETAINLSEHVITTQQLTTFNSRKGTEDIRLATHYIADATRDILGMMEQGPFTYPSIAETIAYENGFSTPQEVQRYGALCQKLLSAYRDWLLKNGFDAPDAGR